jgi:hypothetical protein
MFIKDFAISMIENATDGCKTTRNIVATATGKVSLLAWLTQI